MGRVKVVPATLDHVHQLGPNLRAEDDRECIAASGKIAYDALLKGLEVSDWSKTILSRGEPIAIFGVAPRTYALLNMIGVPWMLGSDKIKENAKAIVVLGKLYTKYMIGSYNKLENYVDARNKVAIKWIKNCGYTVEDPEPFGINGELFHHFYLER